MTAHTEARISFLKIVTRPAGASIELRAMRAGIVVGRAFCRTPNDVNRFINEHLGSDLYFGVAARRAEARNGRLGSCTRLASLFVDLDFKVIAQKVAKDALDGFAFRPSAIVSSGGGFHVYWSLIEGLKLPEDAEHAKGMLRKLAIKLGADLCAAEPVRILRVPATANFKYDPSRRVQIISFNPESRYSISQFEEALSKRSRSRAG